MTRETPGTTPDLEADLLQAAGYIAQTRRASDKALALAARLRARAARVREERERLKVLDDTAWRNGFATALELLCGPLPEPGPTPKGTR